jgi:hypothetical protein
MPPEREDTVTFDPGAIVVDDYYSEICGFPVTAQSSGHIRFTTFYNKDGSIRRLVAYPSIRSTLSSPTETVTTADVGMDRITFNPDGTFNIFGTGIHLKLKDGPKAIGLWRLVLDPETGQLISQEYHGRFDVTAEEIDAAVCEALT